MAQYGTIITNIGLAQIANAQVTQTKVGLDYIALGDGNGAHYVPTQTQTALVREVWRGPIAELSIDPTNSNRIIIDAVIPVTAGGFTIREIGIFDDKNQLIAVGQYPEKYKPELSEGVSEETLIHFVIETNNAEVVKLTIDPTVIIASRKYVDEKVAGINNGLTEITQTVTELETEFTAHKDDFELHTPYLQAISTNGVDYEVVIERLTSLVDGLSFTVKPNMTNLNTGVKLNVNGLGAKYIVHAADGLIFAGLFRKDNPYTVRYNGQFFVLQTGYFGLEDSLTSTSKHYAATANAVKMVNDRLTSRKFIAGGASDANSTSAIGIAIGDISFIKSSQGLAIGTYARIHENSDEASAVGAFTEVTGKYSVALGANTKVLNANEGILGINPNIGTGTHIWKIPGSLTVTGHKNFEIPHPHPTKKHTHIIRHGAVESPTTGDTLYRYSVTATNDGETIEIQLPDYFEYLNTNVDVWVNPDKHFGRAYGEVVGDKLLVTCEKAGTYKALVIGTRNDENVQDWYLKGVEREIGESWTGETYSFEVDEISEVTEFEEVYQ